MTRRNRGLILDLDGVVTDTAELHFHAWARLAADEGLAFERDANERLRGLSRADSLRAILGDREVTPMAFERMLDDKNRHYVTSLAGLSGADLLPGAAALVADARTRGWRLAIGSSSRNAPEVLRRLGLFDAFDAIADGNTVTVAKPAPDVFLAAARMLGVDPERCVVVEDAASGVDAGLAAGMAVVGTGPPDRVGHAHVCVATTADVDLDVLERLVEEQG
ncbi:MAG: beta-phosphoglucomutase [Nitriliruptoraceae bacterium]